VDLFVNFGSSKGLPVSGNSHFNSTSWLSETMEISLQSDQFIGKTSIKGLFVVGVYSEEGATFQLEIDILDHDIEKIYKGTTRTIE